MKFSVLMSVYYKESPNYLKESLESILYNQTLKPNEVVIICDGPLTYELNSVIEFFSKVDIVKVYRLEQNVGLGAALNEGIKYCSHEWICRMDADDICLDSRFKKQFDYIENHPDIVLLGSQVMEFNETMEKVIGIKQVPSENSELRKFALKRNPFNHMTVVYRKSIIEKVGGYQHHLYMEDYNLWLRVIAKGYNVANLTDVLVNVRAGNAMYARRKGIEYIRREFQLAKLKRALQ